MCARIRFPLYVAGQFVKKFSGLQSKIWKKLFTGDVHPHRVDSGALAFVRWYVWLVLVKVVPNRQWRCAPVVRFAAPPLTSTSQTGTWLLRIAHRGFLAGKGFKFLRRRAG